MSKLKAWLFDQYPTLIPSDTDGCVELDDPACDTDEPVADVNAVDVFLQQFNAPLESPQPDASEPF